MNKWLNDIIIKWASSEAKEELIQYKYIDKQLTRTMDVLNNTQNPNNTSIENLEMILENNKDDISNFENSCMAIKLSDAENTTILSLYLPFCFFMLGLKNTYNNFQLGIFTIFLSGIAFCRYIKNVLCKHILEKRLSEIKYKFNKVENKFSEIRRMYENEVLRFTIIREMNLIKEELLKEINKHE